MTVFAAGCGHAGDGAPTAASQSPPGPDEKLTATGGVQREALARDEGSTPPGGDDESLPEAADALCLPAEEGSLHAKVQGAIEAELAWGRDTPQCRGGVRPQGDGLRLVYKGRAPDGGPLLVVFGLAPLRPGESSRNVPVNLTLVREGTGEFFATQGNDKCALDEVRQVPMPGQPHKFRLEGRGYCTQPARSMSGDASVFISRFDVVATIESRPAEVAGTTTAAANGP